MYAYHLHPLPRIFDPHNKCVLCNLFAQSPHVLVCLGSSHVILPGVTLSAVSGSVTLESLRATLDVPEVTSLPPEVHSRCEDSGMEHLRVMMPLST